MLKLPSGPVLHPSIAPFTMLFQRDKGAGCRPGLNFSNSPPASPQGLGWGIKGRGDLCFNEQGPPGGPGVAWVEGTAEGSV